MTYSRVDVREKRIFPSSHTTTSISDEILRGPRRAQEAPGCVLTLSCSFAALAIGFKGAARDEPFCCLAVFRLVGGRLARPRPRHKSRVERGALLGGLILGRPRQYHVADLFGAPWQLLETRVNLPFGKHSSGESCTKLRLKLDVCGRGVTAAPRKHFR